MGTLDEFNEIMADSKTIFMHKMQEYGSAWRILRLSSLVDQLMIKARRIRYLEAGGKQAVADSIEEDLIGILNYSLISLIQIRLGVADTLQDAQLSLPAAKAEYEQEEQEVRELLKAKNQDYDEAWKDMRLSSIIDQILVKILRLNVLIAESGETPTALKSSVFRDIVNYAVFALLYAKQAPSSHEKD